jgi:hypothetical protein
MIGGSFYPETIGLANLAALNTRSAPGMLVRDKADFDGPKIAFCGCILPGLKLRIFETVLGFLT